MMESLLPMVVATIVRFLSTLSESSLIKAITLYTMLGPILKHAIVTCDMFTKAMHHPIVKPTQVE